MKNSLQVEFFSDYDEEGFRQQIQEWLDSRAALGAKDFQALDYKYAATLDDAGHIIYSALFLYEE